MAEHFPHYGFDMDGTVIHTFDFFETACMTSFAEHDLPLTKDQFRELFGTGKKTLTWLHEMNITDQDLINSILRVRDDVMISLLETKTTWMEGALETLEALSRRQNPLHIITNANQHYIAAVRQCLPEIDRHITHLLGPNDVGVKGKPDPSGILLAAKASQRPLNEFVYVGDQWFDCKAARNARVKFCALLGDHTYPAAAENADVRISALPELLELRVEDFT